MFNDMMTYVVDRADDLIHNENKTVCDFGNQTQNNRRILQILKSGKRPYLKDKYESTKQFYEALGYKKYVAIDVNTKLDAIALDLNKDLKTHYNWTEQFDLVTNNGTSEHVFNQYAVFKNMHDLTKVGGYMIHVLPYYKWSDHGFYNYQPQLFACLAAENEYVVEFFCISDDLCTQMKIVPLTMQQTGLDELPKKFNLDEWKRSPGGGDPMIGVISRKVYDNEFKVPMQFGYSRGNIEVSEIANSYKTGDPEVAKKIYRAGIYSEPEDRV